MVQTREFGGKVGQGEWGTARQLAIGNFATPHFAQVGDVWHCVYPSSKDDVLQVQDYQNHQWGQTRSIAVDTAINHMALPREIADATTLPMLWYGEAGDHATVLFEKVKLEP